MTTENAEGKTDETRSAPATGYATAVDAALNAPKYATHLLGGTTYFAEWHHFEALAVEVFRLRAAASLRDAALERVNLLTTGNGVNANPYETIVEVHKVSNDALSHNEVAERRAQGKETK